MKGKGNVCQPRSVTSNFTFQSFDVVLKNLNLFFLYQKIFLMHTSKRNSTACLVEGHRKEGGTLAEKGSTEKWAHISGSNK